MSKNLKLFCVSLALCLLAACEGPRASGSATPTPEHHDHDEHEHGGEGEIKLTPEQVKLSGITVQAAATRDFKSSLKLPATIVGDPDLELKVSVRVEGIVERLFVRVGDTVRPGQVLATMSSQEVARLRADYHAQQSATQLARENLERRLRLNRVGDVVRRPYEEAMREVAAARAQIAGTQAALELNQIKLDRLENLLKDGIASQQQVDEARAAVREVQAKLSRAKLDKQVADTHLAREQRIRSTGLMADNEAYEAQVELKRSQQAENLAREVLLGLGADPDQHVSGALDLISPQHGVVVARPKAQGEHVAAGDTLLTILNPDRVWGWVDLPPDQVQAVSLNSNVEVRVQSLANRHFHARLTFITPDVDPDTKKLRARIELDNAAGQLRPNMFAEVVLPVGQTRKVLSLPEEAVVTVENQSVVYLQEEPGHYERRAVVVGEKSEGWVEIRSGLKAGERVVTAGAMALQSEDLKASMGEAGHQH